MFAAKAMWPARSTNVWLTCTTCSETRPLKASSPFGAATARLNCWTGIDYDLVKKNPKIFCGYSDITALHLAFHQKLGLVTFHGPTANSKFPAFSLNHFRKALFDAAPLGPLTNPSRWPHAAHHPARHGARTADRRQPVADFNLMGT